MIVQPELTNGIASDGPTYWVTEEIFYLKCFHKLVCTIDAWFEIYTPTWLMFSGFISIDCGATTAYKDSITGVYWVPDGNYTSVGKNFANVPGSSVYAQAYSTLRYFDEPRGKFCYVLPGTVVGMAYMIRYSFWYGSYDNAATKPSFNVSIDATIVWNLGPSSYDNSSVTQYEHLYVATKNTIDFCLIRDQTGGSNPFISSLELRTYEAGAYSQSKLLVGNFYMMTFRYNIGGSVEVRWVFVTFLLLMTYWHTYAFKTLMMWFICVRPRAGWQPSPIEQLFLSHFYCF